MKDIPTLYIDPKAPIRLSLVESLRQTPATTLRDAIKRRELWGTYKARAWYTTLEAHDRWVLSGEEAEQKGQGRRLVQADRGRMEIRQAGKGARDARPCKTDKSGSKKSVGRKMGGGKRRARVVDFRTGAPESPGFELLSGPGSQQPAGVDRGDPQSLRLVAGGDASAPDQSAGR